MKASESTNGNNENGDEDDEKESDHNWHISDTVLLLQKHERQRHAEHDKHVDGERDEELQEVAVVATRYAIAHPLFYIYITYIFNNHYLLLKILYFLDAYRTMMIHGLK